MDRMWRECFSQSVTKREIVFGGSATMISLLFLIFAAFEMRLESYPEHIKFLPVLTNLLDNTNGTGPAVRWFYIISILCGPVTAILLIVGILRHNKWLLIPWAVITMVVLVITCAEFYLITLFTTVLTLIIGFMVYIIFALMAFYHKIEEKEREERQRQKRGDHDAIHDETTDTNITYATLKTEPNMNPNISQN